MPTVLEGNCKGENEVASTVKHGGISDSSLTWRLPTMDIGESATHNYRQLSGLRRGQSCFLASQTRTSHVLTSSFARLWLFAWARVTGAVSVSCKPSRLLCALSDQRNPRPELNEATCPTSCICFVSLGPSYPDASVFSGDVCFLEVQDVLTKGDAPRCA